MDVKTSFLNGVVEEEVYIEQPLGFETHDMDSHVCKLKKSLYGLKQEPMTWYGRLKTFYLVWDLSRVKQIPTFTTRLKMETQ